MIYIHFCFFVEKTHQKKHLYLRVGGVANQLLQLLPSYEKIDDLNISIVTKYTEYKPISKRVKIHEIQKFNVSAIDTIYFMVKSFFRLIKIHKKETINIIDVNGYSIIILSPLLIRLLFKIPILMKLPIDFRSFIKQYYMIEKQKIRVKMISYSWVKFFKKFLLKKINFIRSLNEIMYNDLINLKFPKERILKIPNGIDCKTFINVQKIKHEETIFGYVGRLTEFKNLRFLLKVFKTHLILYPKDELFIYGLGSEVRYIEDFIKENKLNNNIIYHGFEKNKLKIYPNIDVLVDPALGQGISNTNLEAMITKTFLIASNVHGNRDLVKHQLTGLLFNPYKEDDLLSQLKFYKEKQEDVINNILNNAKNEIMQKYDIDTITNNVIKFIKAYSRYIKIRD